MTAPAIGVEWMSPTVPEPPATASRAPTADELARRALLAFLLTFMLARTVVFLIMARRIPNLYLFLRDTHVHHLNYGIFLLAAVGAFLLFSPPTPRSRRGAAFAYGIAMALTFDEFGMWLHLGGSYWQRASVDATVVVAGLLAFIAYARSIREFEARHVRAFVALGIAVLVFAMVLYDASVHLAHVEGPRLRELELASSP
jgi:glucose dehydrogenase